MNNEKVIPTSAASRNLIISVITFVFSIFSTIITWWLAGFLLIVSIVFFLKMIYCVLDIQEWRMKQNEFILKNQIKILNMFENILEKCGENKDERP